MLLELIQQTSNIKFVTSISSLDFIEVCIIVCSVQVHVAVIGDFMVRWTELFILNNFAK